MTHYISFRLFIYFYPTYHIFLSISSQLCFTIHLIIVNLYQKYKITVNLIVNNSNFVKLRFFNIFKFCTIEKMKVIFNMRRKEYCFYLILK